MNMNINNAYNIYNNYKGLFMYKTYIMFLYNNIHKFINIYKQITQLIYINILIIQSLSIYFFYNIFNHLLLYFTKMNGSRIEMQIFIDLDGNLIIF